MQEETVAIKLARPKQRIRARVEKRGELAILQLDNGTTAVVPLQELCKIADRFNLDIENYKCTS